MSDEKPVPSKIIPNTFQTPNALVDNDIMFVLTGNETKCYLVIVRKTFGWHKQTDRIAKSQIIALTGLGERAVDGCMDALVDMGLVLRLAENNPILNQGVLWGLQTDDSKISWDKLHQRIDDRNKKQAERMEKARSKRGVGLLDNTRVIGQPRGGVIGQPPQKPLSKAIVLVVVNADVAKISELYEQEFGAITAMIADAIKDAVETYPPDWIPEAMDIAVLANKRNWGYVEGILKNCQAKKIRPSLNKLEAKNGHNGSGAKQGTGSKQQGSDPVADKQYAEKIAEINRRRKLKREQQPTSVS